MFTVFVSQEKNCPEIGADQDKYTIVSHVMNLMNGAESVVRPSNFYIHIYRKKSQKLLHNFGHNGSAQNTRLPLVNLLSSKVCYIQSMSCLLHNIFRGYIQKTRVNCDREKTRGREKKTKLFLLQLTRRKKNKAQRKKVT